MRVEASNGMIFEEGDPLCTLRVVQSQGKLYAFLQAIDTGMDGMARYPVRYWGEYCHDTPVDAIRQILLWGGKWDESGPL